MIYVTQIRVEAAHVTVLNPEKIIIGEKIFIKEHSPVK